MASVRYYLRFPQITDKRKHARDEDAPRNIYLKFKYAGQELMYSVGVSVDPANWNKETQRVKEKKTTAPSDKGSGLVYVNELLDKLSVMLTKEYYRLLPSGIPPVDMLRTYLDEFMNKNLLKESKAKQQATLMDLIDRFIAGTVGEKKTKATITTYKTAKKHLEAYERAKKTKLNFEDITLEFKYDYVNFLEKDKTKIILQGKKQVKVPVKGMAPNSVFKEIKNIKTFMSMATELGYTSNLAYKSKKFGVKEADTDAVALDDRELRKLYKFDFTTQPRLEGVRDLFVFSAFTGLRFSDASRVKAENIVKVGGHDMIKIKSQKTGQQIMIPCNDIVLNIFKKYGDNKLPTPISNQKFNQYLKELAELAGMTERGRLNGDMNKPLNEVISSHTARRSFATNAYRAGWDIRLIMAATGHKTEKSFLKYIKITQEEYALRMAKHMQSNFNNVNLKAV